jgi:hypothetical protein
VLRFVKCDRRVNKKARRGNLWVKEDARLAK